MTHTEARDLVYNWPFASYLDSAGRDTLVELLVETARAGYFPAVRNLQLRNRELHDRAQRAETALGRDEGLEVKILRRAVRQLKGTIRGQTKTIERMQQQLGAWMFQGRVLCEKGGA